MQKILIALLLALTALSGCMSDADDDGTGAGGTGAAAADTDGDGFTDDQEAKSGTDPADATSKPKVPEALQFEGTLRGLGDSFGTGQSTACQANDSPAEVEQDPGCAVHEIVVPAPGWKVTFKLTPGDGTISSAADYDLFIYDSAGVLIADSTNPGGEVDSATKTLAAGTYTAKIMAWDNVDAPYTLDVTFAF